MPSGYRVLDPDNKGFGRLRGAIVKNAVADDIEPLFTAENKQASDYMKWLAKAGKVWRGGVTASKVGHTVLNPPVYVTNSVGNILQSVLMGMPPKDVVGLYIQSGKEMLAASRGKLGSDFTAVQKLGGFRSSFSSSELEEVLGGLTGVKDTPILGALSKLVQGAGKAYGTIDDIARLANYKYALKQMGKGSDDAFLLANKYTMDYSLVNPAIRSMRKDIIPVGATYLSKVIPLLADTASTPRGAITLAAIAGLPYTLSVASRAYQGLTEGDYDRLISDLSSYNRSSPFKMLLPVKNDRGEYQWIDAGKYLPGGNLVTAGINLSQGEGGDAARSVGVGENPWFDIAISALKQRGGDPPLYPSSGKPLYSNLASPEEKLLGVLGFIYGEFAPTVLMFTGRSGTVGLAYKAISGTPESKYRPVPTVKGVVQSVAGVRPFTSNAAESAATRHVIITKLRATLRKDLSKLRLRGGSEEEAKRLLERFTLALEKERKR